MTKIKIIIHSKTIGYSGTDRTASLHATYLAQDCRFEPFILYREDGENSRLSLMQELLGKDHVLPYLWVPGKRGRIAPYMPEQDNFYEVIQSINPDIVTYHLSGYNEWPCMKYLSPRAKIVSINIFGFNDHTRQADKVVYISNFIRNTAMNAGSPDGPVLYNPIQLPYQGCDNWEGWKWICKKEVCAKLQISEDSILGLRVGRPAHFDPIALKAFKHLSDEYSNCYYLVVSPSQEWYDWVRRYNIRNVIFLPTIIDDIELSTLHAAADIYMHSREDGECDSVSIGQAMMHHLPIISHYGSTFNGHAEQLTDVGFIVPRHNNDAYYQCLRELYLHKELRNEFGEKAFLKAENEREASKIVERLKEIYLGVLKREMV